MKKNLDVTYFGNLLPIISLEHIYQIYSSDIQNNIYQAKLNLISEETKEQNIKKLVSDSLKLWNSYKSIYKNEFEFELIDFTNTQIEAISRYNIETLEKKLSYLAYIINNIIEYELFIAKEERNLVKILYGNTISQLIYILVTMVLLSILIYVPLMRNIFKTQKNLENTNKSLKNLSITDALTGLYNRRHFNNIMNLELTRAVRNGEFITFILLDIDHFKRYNDTYGHQKGDIAIQSIAKVLLESTPDNNYAFRIGGEEFAIIIKNCNYEDAKEFTERLLKRVRSMNMEHKSSDKGILTISIGAISIEPFDSLIEESIIKIADDNLYSAKDLGRDNAVVTMID
jgi:diguanylate cyclase (GGDEF)-like protein